jgi:hypothetical protein
VIASGGIGDGRGIARALRLGAQGVSLGTRFVASEEAWIHPHHKQRVVAAGASDTEYANDLFYVGWPDAPHRYLKNKTSRAWNDAGRPPIGRRPGEGEVIGRMRLPWGDQEWHRYECGIGMLVPTFDGDPDEGVMWAGLSVEQVRDIKPAGAIVRDLVRETEAATWPCQPTYVERPPRGAELPRTNSSPMSTRVKTAIAAPTIPSVAEMVGPNPNRPGATMIRPGGPPRGLAVSCSMRRPMPYPSRNAPMTSVSSTLPTRSATHESSRSLRWTAQRATTMSANPRPMESANFRSASDSGSMRVSKVLSAI